MIHVDNTPVIRMVHHDVIRFNVELLEAFLCFKTLTDFYYILITHKTQSIGIETAKHQW